MNLCAAKTAITAGERDGREAFMNCGLPFFVSRNDASRRGGNPRERLAGRVQDDPNSDQDDQQKEIGLCVAEAP